MTVFTIQPFVYNLLPNRYCSANGTWSCNVLDLRCGRRMRCIMLEAMCTMRIQEITYILIECAQFTRLRKTVVTNITCKEIKFGKGIFLDFWLNFSISEIDTAAMLPSCLLLVYHHCGNLWYCFSLCVKCIILSRIFNSRYFFALQIFFFLSRKAAWHLWYTRKYAIFPDFFTFPGVFAREAVLLPTNPLLLGPSTEEI